MIPTETKNEPQKEKLSSEIKELAQSRGWPALKLSPFWPTIMSSLLTGLFVGLVILFLLTRGKMEGVIDLLKGGGSGVGLIIIVITTFIGSFVGFIKAMNTTSGEDAWNTWLSKGTLDNNTLLRVKQLLEKPEK